MKIKNGDLKILIKMVLGMILLGIGYLVLILVVLKIGSDESNIIIKVNLLFIVFIYMFYIIGELFLLFIGLFMVSVIVFVKLVLLLMGVWLVGIGCVNLLVG